MLIQHSQGGRLVRIRTCLPGWVTLVSAPFSSCGHGNVLPDECARATQRKRHRPHLGVTLMRLVGFNTRGVVNFVGKVRNLPTSQRQQEWNEIVDKLDVKLRESMGLPREART